MNSFSDEKKTSGEVIIQYLDENLSKYLSLWGDQIIIDKKDTHKEQVVRNGIQMYGLVKQALMNTIKDDELKNLAEQVALQRFDANINIGDFIYNVNTGRSIIIKQVNKSGVTVEVLEDAIDKINLQFDQFCYYAVTKYTQLINDKLIERQKYIADTHKDKLAILGQMSSSFVHEFRNPLTAIMGFTRLLKKEFPSHKYIEIIEMELDQLNFRITQFLHTSKLESSSEHTERLTLKELLNEILKFIYPSLVDADVNVITEFDEDIFIRGNSGELKQVFLNILFNSIDAIKQREKPREIKVICTEEKGQACIKFSNNGPPIPKDIKETIFEPFYTTKELGTGIGLFVSKSIVEKHDGQITCYSDEEITYFKIELPIDCDK